MKSRTLLLLASWTALSAGLWGCDSSGSTTDSGGGSPADSTVGLMVASDLHYFSPSLMTDTASAAFHAYLAEDRKMIVQSPALLHSFLDSVRARRPGVLLLTGDLTKDGEKASHRELADSLATLRASGIRVYVIPGNHDVANPESRAYASDVASAVDGVTAAEFASIYHDCGFDQALARDTASLSYVVEPVPGVRLLALDPTRWRDNRPGGTETVGGRFLPQTVAWIRTQLRQATDSGKRVVGAMHHGILEHFQGQATNPVSADYVVAGRDSLDTLFANHGLHVVFTGHFHANDIASKVFSGGSLVDIETGSLVTSPSPFRTGSISASRGVEVRTSRIREIRGFSGDFPAWSNAFLLSGMTQLSQATLVGQFGLDSATAAPLAPLVAAAYAAHYSGDERGVPSAYAGTVSAIAASGASGQFLAGSITSLFTDLAPADSAGVFPLR